MTVPSGSSFSLCSYTRMTTDVYKPNDTLCKSVSICNLSSPGTIVGASTVSPGTNNVMYRITVPVSGATSYNWTYTGTNVVINGDGNNKYTAYLNFASNATAGVLTVRAWNGICEGAAANLSIGVIGVDNIDADNLWLGQNLPNPTAANTNIEYGLPVSGKVKFTVMNLYGQTVYETENEATAGKHKVNLNVKDLAAGIYYYSLEFKGKRLVKKMVVNK